MELLYLRVPEYKGFAAAEHRQTIQLVLVSIRGEWRMVGGTFKSRSYVFCTVGILWFSFDSGFQNLRGRPKVFVLKNLFVLLGPMIFFWRLCVNSMLAPQKNVSCAVEELIVN